MRKNVEDSSDAITYQNPVLLNGKVIPGKRKLIIEVLETLKKNIDTSANGRNKRVGHMTQEKRRSAMISMVSDLNHLGFNISSMNNLREKHIFGLVELMIKKGQKPSTIQNKLSVLRIYCSWIGKCGMVRSPEYYVTDATLVKRVTATNTDKSWDNKNIDHLIESVSKKDPIVGLQLKLCNQFGLRRLEAIMLKPRISDEGAHLHVRAGTKGGRPRMVPIATDQQRSLLEEAKRLADPKSELICRPGKTLKQAINRFKYVLRYCCITRAGEGVTAHGLRHGYVHHRYKARTGGGKLPIKGGWPGEVDPVVDKVAKLKVMEEVGHSRLSVTTAYGGTFGHAGRSYKPHYSTITEQQSDSICTMLERLEQNGLAGPKYEASSQT